MPERNFKNLSVLKRNENLCVGESTVLMSPSMLLFLDFTVVALNDYIQNNT